ncbi:VOC family protein [Methyloceanibacter caenitepidi]|uniref:3-demethylubiquinone-9 3-methyltransferase n=1 Tax=Methyloceanibacter caenitepidi TaxID=1384459 RepID=A0A0A8K991_9HYPH|nr:3-demethylubiquinone-9 3-methyltransferase [Methyloceanibacter caenitepidi]
MADTEFREEGLSLEIQCDLDAPRSAVWRCWTEPDLLKQWFCPKPWQVSEADFDLRPGGRMNTVMVGPDGTRMDNTGIWLEIVSGKRLTFTDAYSEGFVPRESSFMTGYVALSDAPGQRTTMVWGARHSKAADKQAHLEMGFQRGWSAAAAQLEELARSLANGTGAAPLPMTFKSKVRTCFWFESGGQEAAEFYVSLLPDSEIDGIYSHGQPDDPMVVEFTLAGAPMMILTGGPYHKLSPAASISVLTKSQGETDRLWSKLIEGGGEESKCGWLVDRFGVSWQVIPEALPRLLGHPDAAAAGRAQAAMMQMTKIDVAALEAAAAGQ